jgi:hypothetical protein
MRMWVPRCAYVCYISTFSFWSGCCQAEAGFPEKLSVISRDELNNSAFVSGAIVPDTPRRQELAYKVGNLFDELARFQYPEQDLKQATQNEHGKSQGGAVFRTIRAHGCVQGKNRRRDRRHGTDGRGHLSRRTGEQGSKRPDKYGAVNSGNRTPTEETPIAKSQ